MYQPLDAVRLGNAHQHFFSHLMTMPGWHKVVLTLGVVLGIIGGTGVAANKVVAPPKTDNTPSAPTPHVTRPQGSSGFAADTTPDAPVPSGAAPTPSAVASDTAPFGGILSRISPHAMRVGISIVVGFILGWLFRAFIKMMTLVAIVGIGLLAALSYFHVVNVDLSTVKTEYVSVIHWLADQSTRLKDVVIAHLPSTGGGTLGTYLGLRRK